MGSNFKTNWKGFLGILANADLAGFQLTICKFEDIIVKKAAK